MNSLSWQKHTNKASVSIPVAVQADRQETRPHPLVKHHLPVVVELQQRWSRHKVRISDPLGLES